MTDPAIIAVDGPAASGKGTLARKLAAHFNFAYLDTGALYRAVALSVIDMGGQVETEADAVAAARRFDMSRLADTDFAAALRTAETGRAASVVAAMPDVRAAIISAQRQFAETPPGGKAGAVLDGRDIGTNICPDAAAKLFITARADIRAERRWRELQADDATLSFETVLNDIEVRDARDAGRAAAPMRQAEDAHLLDTSDLSIEEAFAAALALVEGKLNR
ncbi:MAG: (d)CMP kinase [Alphaproteobacteria bacterium]|nr:(d)CMP kinase [Alphaproteobacteria bacterium]